MIKIIFVIGHLVNNQRGINMNNKDSIEMLSLRNELAENNEAAAIREKFYQGRVLILVRELEQTKSELNFMRICHG